MSFEIAFVGMVLVCSGSPECQNPSFDYSHAAYALETRAGENVCGWQSDVETVPLIAIPSSAAIFENNLYCKENVFSGLDCLLPEEPLCIESFSGLGLIEDPQNLLIELADLDGRAGKVRKDRLEDRDFINTSMFFWADRLRPDFAWTNEGQEINWFLSGSRKGPKSRAIIAEINRPELVVMNCQTLETLLRARLEPDTRAVFKNYSMTEYFPPTRSDDWTYLPYLHWFYRLTHWADVGGDCPNRSHVKPKTLECLPLESQNSPDLSRSCAWTIEAESVFWPAVISESRP